MNQKFREEVRSIDSCQLCGHSGAYELLTKKKLYKGIKLQSRWVECTNCNSAHIDPYPSEEDLFKYYKTGYVDMDFGGTSDEDASHIAHYSPDYLPIVFKNYGYSLSDAGVSSEYLKGKYILDYGCATGLFIRYLTDICNVSAHQIYGVDVDSDMLEASKKISPNIFSLNQKHLINQRFDLITLWNVIEHIHDPKNAIGSLIHLLEDHGEILVETPMFGTLALKMEDRWAHFIIIEHINLFSRNALKKFFEDLGMECVHESSFGANLSGSIDNVVKNALDSIAKEKDFGATQVLRFRKI